MCGHCGEPIAGHPKCGACRILVGSSGHAETELFEVRAAVATTLNEMTTSTKKPRDIVVKPMGKRSMKLCPSCYHRALQGQRLIPAGVR